MKNPLPIVDDYMTKTLYTFLPSDNIHVAVKTLLERHLSGAPVLDKSGNLVGILSKKDCLQVVYTASYHQDWGGRVDEFMHAEVETIDSGTDIIVAADLFVSKGYRRFPVVKQHKIIGQISRHDILQALYDQWGHFG